MFVYRLGEEIANSGTFHCPPGVADAYPTVVSTAVFISFAPVTRQLSGERGVHMWKRETLSVPWPPWWAHGIQGELEQEAADLPLGYHP